MSRPLFALRLQIRVNAPTSAFHDQLGTVDAYDLERARTRTVTVHFDDDRSTIAFADELQVVGEPVVTPLGEGADKSERRSS